MMTGRTVSVGNILWKVLKQPIVQDLKYEDAAEYAIEYLRLIGAALSFEDKVTRIKLNSYKGLLPANLINIKGKSKRKTSFKQNLTVLKNPHFKYFISKT